MSRRFLNVSLSGRVRRFLRITSIYEYSRLTYGTHQFYKMSFEDVEERDGLCFRVRVLMALLTICMVASRRPLVVECVALFKDRSNANSCTDIGVVHSSQAT